MRTRAYGHLAALALLSSACGVAAQAPDAAAGGELFKQRCSVCHATTGDKPGIGPSLAGVVGRKAASTGFTYSAALKASGLVWNPKTLDSFLTAPGQLVSGTRMVISVSDPKQRADVVAYLGTLKK
jgi:cytochrome c